MKTFISIFIFSLSAYCIKGSYTTNNSRSICQVNYEVSCPHDKSKTCQGVCSATYIGEKKLVSADHCREAMIFAIKKPSVICPGTKRISIKKKYPFPKSSFSLSQDVAIFELEKKPIDSKTNTETKAMRFVKNETEAKKLLENKKNCFISGYGLDNENKSGIQKTAALKSIQINGVSRINNSGSIFKASKQLKLSENYSDHGDSGGPLYCKSTDGSLILVGMNQGKTKDFEFSFSEKLAGLSEWFELHLKHPDNADLLLLEYKKQSKYCNYIAECLSEHKKANTLAKDSLKIIEAFLKKQLLQSVSFRKLIEAKNSQKMLGKIEAINSEWSRLNNICAQN